MKKMVFMAAIVAACTAFVACSSDDDLVQQKPDVPEESVEECYPMTVKVVDFASRGNDWTSTTLENFTLYSTMTDAWKTGKLFGKDAGGNWTTNGDLGWPDENTYTFFGISDGVGVVDDFADINENEGAGDDHPDAPAVTATTCSFNYKMPLLNSRKPREDFDEYYYNSEDLKDLLVAKTTGSKNTGDPAGSLEVQFQHALAQITAIKVYVNQGRLVDKEFTNAASNMYVFRIGGARVGGIKAVGTYTFDAIDPWVAKAGSEEKFEIPLQPESFEDAVFMAKGSAKKVLPLTDDGFYIIPQAANGNVTNQPTEGVVSGGEYGITGPYIEFDIQVYQKNGSEPESRTGTYGDGNYRVGYNLNDFENNFKWDSDASNVIGYGQVRCPLKFQKLEAGKGYALLIDLGLGVIYTNGEDGDYCTSEPVFNNLKITAG